MLVLSRKENETIIIDGRIKVRINQIRGNKVSVGIEASDDVAILRAELQDHDEFFDGEFASQQRELAVR